MALYQKLQDNNWNLPPEEVSEYNANWGRLAQETMNCLNEDPKGPTGQRIAEKWIAQCNRVYTGEYVALGEAIWHKGYRTGRIKRYSPELIEWTTIAIDYFDEEQIKALTEKMSHALTSEHVKLKKEWHDLMERMFGSNQTEKDKIEKNLPDHVRSWL